jgi:hypothetical protein
MFIHFQLVLDDEKKIKLALRVNSENEVNLIHHRLSDPLDKTESIDPVLLQMLPNPADIALLALFTGLSVEIPELTAIADNETVVKGLAQEAEEKAKAAEAETVIEA